MFVTLSGSTVTKKIQFRCFSGESQSRAVIAMAHSVLVAEKLRKLLGPVEHALRVQQAKAELVALGDKYDGREIPVKELLKYRDIDGLLDTALRRNLEYIHIGNGDLTEEELSDLERKGINNVNLFVDPQGWTPICRAIRQDNESMIIRILSHPDFDPNVRNQDKNHPATPLMIAAEHRPQYLELILTASGLDADEVDIFGYSPLAIVMQYHPGYLPVMLASGKVSVNKQNCKASSALEFAVQKCTERELTLLLESGASVEKYDGVQPILIALLTGNFHMLPILCQFGARLPVSYLKEQVRRRKIVLDEVGPHLLQSGLFTEAQLKAEFFWTSGVRRRLF